MTEIAPYLHHIRTAYPDLAIGHIRQVEGGQYNVVLIADERLIFRFPRFAAGVERLRYESALLAAIRPRLTLSVPEPRYASFVPPEPGAAFVGYPLLPGDPLWRERVAVSDPAVRDRLAAQLAGFLRSLHAVSVGDLPAGTPLALGFTDPDWRVGWTSLCGRIEALVLPRLGAATRALLVAEFAAFLNDDANFAFAPTLIHGDFGTGNILWDRARGAITAVLDFGAAGLGDPACDLAALLTYGEAFAQAGYAAYPALATLLSRARFYRSTFALQEALYGVEHGDDAAIARGIAPYALGE